MFYMHIIIYREFDDIKMEAHVILTDWAAYQAAFASGFAQEMCDAYLAEYDLTRDTVPHNWAAIKEELERVFS